MKIAVVGTGYVGLVVGACLAENGNDVVCVDKDQAKIAMLEAGQMPIYEPGLEEMVRRNHSEERLTFTTDLQAAVQASEIVFIAVGTPQGEDGSADLQHVLAVARDIGRAMNKYTVVVDKSTVPVGTAKKVHATIAAETTQSFSVVSNPEFLKQGAAIEDFMKPDRVVIGCDDERSAEVMREVYGPFTRTGAPIMVMDTASAELCKYAANSILATRISFMNEIANVCEAVGRRRGSGAQGDGRGPPNRQLVPLSWRRVRRQLLSEGRQGADPVVGRHRLRLPDPRSRGGRERIAEVTARRRRCRITSAISAARRSPCGAWPSSRGPTTCGRRRPSPSSSGCSRSARRSGPTIRRRSDGAGDLR